MTEIVQSHAEIRSLITKAKRRDTIFVVLGILGLGFGLLTFVVLFLDMLLDGWSRLAPEFFSQFPSRRAGQAGILSAWVGTTLVMIVTAAVAVPSGWAPASTSRNTRRRTGSPTSSRSTSPTSRACPRSCTVSWRSVCSCTRSGSARACKPRASRWRS